MYTVLTAFDVHIKISSAVPVCCITVDFNVNFFPVEHKKLRIRRNLLDVKM